MLIAALILYILAVVAGFLGFGAISVGVRGPAQIAFFVLITLASISLIADYATGPSKPSAE